MVRVDDLVADLKCHVPPDVLLDVRFRLALYE
jgi:hypothetical protein